MALYTKYDFPAGNGKGVPASELELQAVAPAKIDEMLLEALEALEQTRRLHDSTPNPETKRQAKRIIDSLYASLLKLAPLGVHSAGRLERVPAVS